MFIEEFPGSVSQEICEKFITLFENDPARKPSTVIVGGVKSVKKIRSGTQLLKFQSKEWKPLLEAVAPALNSSIRQYAEKYRGLASLVASEGLVCTVPTIERVDPGQGFDWHYDQTLASAHRVVAGLLYLRTIHDGGATEFADHGRGVQPEAGKIVLFPPYWTHLHRGATPTAETKYVLGFFWAFQPVPLSEKE